MKFPKILYIFVTKKQKIWNILVSIGTPKKYFGLNKINYLKNIILNL